MSRFEFATAARIIFGESTFREAAPIARSLGRRALVVAGIEGEILDSLLEGLRGQGMAGYTLAVTGEPTVETVISGLRYLKVMGCDVVIGLGGGSAIDTGKALAVLATNPDEVLDYLEVIGKGKELTEPGLPFIAIPTTAGTGVEVTRNAVLGSAEHHVKVSLRSPLLFPKVALVDPELTYALPPEITAYTGMDALTQLIEPFVSVAANPLTDSICREGLQRAAQSLLRAYQDGGDREARRGMALASLMGGLALANARLGAVHGFAGPIGGMFPIPHGLICARLLPIVMEVNLRLLRQRQPAGEAERRYTEVARLLTGDTQARAEDGVRWVSELGAALNIPALGDFGVTPQAVPTLVQMAARASSMKGNPLPLSEDELTEILERAILPDGA